MFANNPTRKIWRGRIFAYAPLFLWIGLIFFFSSNLGSMSHTSRFVRPLLAFLFPNAPEEVLGIYHGYIRKFAHFAEYAGLAFWAARAFSKSSKKILREFWFAAAFLLVALIACADEFNQSFNAARTSSVFDVLLDCAGGATMILIYLFIKRKNANAAKFSDFRLPNG